MQKFKRILKANPTEEVKENVCNALSIKKALAIVLAQRGVSDFNSAKIFLDPN